MRHHAWGTDPEGVYRDWLVQKCKGCEAVAEVGVFAGSTTLRLAKETEVPLIVAVDHWRGVPHDPTQAAIYRDLKKTRKLFHSRLRPWILEKRVQVLEMGSPSAAIRCHEWGVKFDLIFLDADHRYTNTRRDIRAWSGLVRPGGILCGHDIGWPGVRRAVEEELPRSWMMGSGSTWWSFLP